ncbi:MAG: acyl-CoA dehydrogenase [Deltaproteobacteria bacterium]|nr:acyl-CoA dehydrogenase [Deltaproteobacteria bacterium]
MSNSLVNTRDQRFVLYEQIGIENLFQYEKYADYSIDMVDMVLTEGEKFALEEILPTYEIADKEDPAVFTDGNAHAPKCYHKPFKNLREAGWFCPIFPVEVGGQGMPQVIYNANSEMFGSANYSFMMYVGLTLGAAALIAEYGTEEQKNKYLYKMAAGEWAGTMCLTEPGAGSDVGASRATAKLLPDGTYSITGTKCFISAGDHDLTENIIHPVLARIEGDPPGTKGISIFIVPKIRANDDGSLGESNDVITGNIEHKMGIKGSATATLNFGENGNCIGELLGSERQGMKIMFKMMNEARLASAALEHAIAYAKERVQSRDMTSQSPEGAPIIKHPDIRRSLLWMKSHVEGMRSMNYWIGYCIDMSEIAETEEERAKWDGYVELITPVIKAYCSDKGVEICGLAMDVYGGYGYCQEYPMEQYMRDCKIAPIYEGTNAIQSLDLVFRKLGQRKGQNAMNLLTDMGATAEKCKAIEGLKESAGYLGEATAAFGDVLMQFGTWLKGGDFMSPLINTRPFLMIMGDAIVGWRLLDAASIASGKLDALFKEAGADTPEAQRELGKNNAEVAFYMGKMASAKFFAANILTTVEARFKTIKLADKTPVEMLEESFTI